MRSDSLKPTYFLHTYTIFSYYIKTVSLHLYIVITFLFPERILHMNKNTAFFKVVFFSILMMVFTLTPFSAHIFNSDAVTVYAKSHKAKISLNTRKKAIVKDSTFRISVYCTKKKHKVFFKSSAPEIASISKASKKYSLITAHKVGDASITVTIKKNDVTVKTLTCQIKVTPPAMSVRFKQSPIIVEVGKQVKLLKHISLKPKYTAEMPIFTISESSLATISGTGVLTAKEIGEIMVTATISNGKTDTCLIKIVPQNHNSN